MRKHLHWKLTGNRTNAAYWLGALAFVYAAATQWVWSLALMAFFIEAVVIALYSAVVHRFFAHRAFEMNPTLAWTLSIPGVLYSLASPIVFAAAHWTHHAFADTERDSHPKGWRGVLTASYCDIPARSLRAAHWFVNARHEVLYRYGTALILGFWAVLLLLGGVQALLWVGLIPTFFIHLFHGIHRTFGHYSVGGGRRVWWAEFILPMGGDWLHDEHHRDPKVAVLSHRWYEFDPGGMFIRLLRRTA